MDVLPCHLSSGCVCECVSECVGGVNAVGPTVINLTGCVTGLRNAAESAATRDTRMERSGADKR